MKRKIFLLTLGFTIKLSSSLAYAENFQFQNIRVGGTGCPSDVTQIIMAPDSTSASILFQQFESHVPAVVENPKATPYFSILNCNVFLDIKIPAGQKLESLEINYDLRGHAFLEPGVSGNFRSYIISSNGLGTERSQGGQLLQQKEWLLTGVDQEEDFIVQATKSLQIHSDCNGGESNERSRVSIHLQHQLGSQINRGYERSNTSGTITVDSSDLSGGIRFKATTSTCRLGPSGPAGPRPMPAPGQGRNCRVIRVNGRAQTICQ